MPALPALGWQVPAAKAAVQQLQVAGAWLAARISAAAYAHLPLGAIGGDWVIDAADALYARQLREAGHLLWVADASQPDLGSTPVDEAEALTLREQQQQIEVRAVQFVGAAGRVMGGVLRWGCGLIPCTAVSHPLAASWRCRFASRAPTAACAWSCG